MSVWLSLLSLASALSIPQTWSTVLTMHLLWLLIHTKCISVLQSYFKKNLHLPSRHFCWVNFSFFSPKSKSPTSHCKYFPRMGTNKSQFFFIKSQFLEKFWFTHYTLEKSGSFSKWTTTKFPSPPYMCPKWVSLLWSTQERWDHLSSNTNPPITKYNHSWFVNFQFFFQFWKKFPNLVCSPRQQCRLTSPIMIMKHPLIIIIFLATCKVSLQLIFLL